MNSFSKNTLQVHMYAKSAVSKAPNKIEGKYRNCNYQIVFNDNEITVFTNAQTAKDAHSAFALLYFIFYVVCGYGLKIEEMRYNDELRPLDQLIGIYNTNDGYKNQNARLIHYLDELDYNKCLKKCENIDRRVMNSLLYIISENYEHIAADHKLLLQLICVEGVCRVLGITGASDAEVIQRCPELRNTFARGKVNSYIKKIEPFINRYCFKYEKKYSLNMLRDSDISQADFFLILADTRDSNAHLMTGDERLKECIEKGSAMQFLILLMQYCTRLALFEYFECVPSDVLSKEYFCMLHDWYSENVVDGEIPYLSLTYTTMQAWEQFHNSLKI